MRHGAADADIRQNRIAGVEEICVPDGRLRSVNAEVRLVLEFGRSHGVDIDQIEVPGEQRRLRHRAFPYNLPAQHVDRRALAAAIAIGRPAPAGIVLEAVQLDIAPRSVVSHHVGAGADRLVPAAVGVDGIGVQHRHRTAVEARHCRQKHRIRFGKRDDEGVIVLCLCGRHLDVVLAVEKVLAVGFGSLSCEPVPGPFHITGGHFFAIVKLHALSELECVGASVLGNLVALGQHGDDAEIARIGYEPFDHVTVHFIGVAVARHARIGAANVGVERCPHHAVGHGRRDAAEADCCRERN